MADPSKPVPSWPAWMEDWVLPFIREPVLWPVWLAILGHVVLLVALAVLEVWRGTGFWIFLFTTAASLALAAWEIRLFGRPGGVGVSILGTWIGAAVLVAIAVRTGFL